MNVLRTRGHSTIKTKNTLPNLTSPALTRPGSHTPKAAPFVGFQRIDWQKNGVARVRVLVPAPIRLQTAPLLSCERVSWQKIARRISRIQRIGVLINRCPVLSLCKTTGPGVGSNVGARFKAFATTERR